MTDEQYALCEVVADMARLLATHDKAPDSPRMVVYLALEWANEFYLIHKGLHWLDYDYVEEVEQFFSVKMRQYRNALAKPLVEDPA